MAEYRYLLSNEWKGARERLSLLEATADPRTIRHFGKVGRHEARLNVMVGVAKLEPITKSDAGFAPLVAAAQALVTPPSKLGRPPE